MLVAALFVLQALPFSPGPPLPAAQGGDCRVAPIDVCNSDGAGSGLIAEIPVLPPAAVDVTAPSAMQAVPAVLTAPLPDGFALPVYRPPRRAS